MKTIIASLSAVIALSLPVFAVAATWSIDPDHSNVGFKVRHLMVSNVKGSFDRFAGTVDINDADIAKSRVEVRIETASINTNVAKRDEHLRSGEFFDVAKHPAMTFVSKRVLNGGKDRIKVIGDLTLRGITKEVVLDVEGPTKESKDPWGALRRGATATAKINRKDFGLVWNKALETGGVAIGDEVTIALEIEMIKK